MNSLGTNNNETNKYNTYRNSLKGTNNTKSKRNTAADDSPHEHHDKYPKYYKIDTKTDVIWKAEKVLTGFRSERSNQKGRSLFLYFLYPFRLLSGCAVHLRMILPYKVFACCGPTAL